ncbi:uncharacterized protein [Asterias amurensis]|uniref:uncharacterized protein isoform X2 n=1 Tax=Asterias amurensis TaxID=7602 RepID=UPI003AB1F873
MIPNLMEDYVLHIQQHESIDIGMLQLAVLSDDEEGLPSYKHHGMLENSVWTRVTTRFINTGNEDILSLLSYLTCGITSDVDHLSAKNERDVDFVHHDGEMYEILPSSDVDSTPKEQTDHCHVKQDITKKRKAVFTADRNFYSANDLYCESILSVNVLNNLVSQQHPQMVCLCRHLTSKVLSDPFVNSSGSHYDEMSIFWNEKHFSKDPTPSLTDDNWLTTFSICAPTGPQLDKQNKQDVFVEETLSGIQMSLSVIEYCDRLKCICEMISDQQGDCVQLLDKAIIEQEISGNLNKLAGSSQLLSINVEGFERTVINEPSFKNFNTEGLTERKSETVCDQLEFPTDGQQMLTTLEQCDCQMNKFDLSTTQLMSCNLQTTESYTEVQALETEKHFMQTLAMSLQVPNLKEEKSACSAVLLAVCGLHATQLRPNDLDLTLPWDPVNKSANNAVKTDEDMSTESFSQCHDKNADHELSTFTTDKIQKFNLGISFNDENVTSWYEAACSCTRSKPLTPVVVNKPKQNTTKVPTAKVKTEQAGHQHTASLVDNFFLLRMGHVKTETMKPKKNDKHPSTSVPYADCDIRGHTLMLIGSERITQESNLLLLLKSRHNIEILECNYKELYKDSVFLGLGDELCYADVCVDEMTGIVLEDFSIVRDSISLEALTRRLAKLSLQYCCCWLILLCYPLTNNMAYLDDHDDQTDRNMALLHEAVRQFSTNANQFEIKIRYSDSDISTADLVHSIAYKACRNTTWDDKDLLQRSWLKLQLTQDEKLLIRIPCITPFTAQLMSSTNSPSSCLLAMSLPSLIQLCPWIPHKILELFVELSRDVPSISAGHIDSYNEAAFYDEARNKDAVESIEWDHNAASWKSTIADQQGIPFYYTSEENSNLHAHQADASSSHLEGNKIVMSEENESRNPLCHWNQAEQTDDNGWKLAGHSPFNPYANSKCNDELAKHKGDEQIMFRLDDKHPTKYHSTSSKNYVALSKRDEVNRISKTRHIATMSQITSDNISDDNSLRYNDWRHQGEKYFDNMKRMHQHSKSALNDTDLEFGVAPDNQLESLKRQRLTYERIPGARDGQTRLTFI